MLYKKSLSKTVCRWRCDRICITCDNLTGVIQISLLLYRPTNTNLLDWFTIKDNERMLNLLAMGNTSEH